MSVPIVGGPFTSCATFGIAVAGFNSALDNSAIAFQSLAVMGLRNGQPHFDSRSRERPSNRFSFSLGFADTGAAFFFRAALIAIVVVGFDLFLHRNDPHPPSLDLLLVLGAPLAVVCLLLSLGFYIWERQLRRRLRERNQV